MCSTGGNGDLDTVQLRHDLFVKEVQKGEDHTVREVSFVEHTHEVINADRSHLLTELAGDRVCSGASPLSPIAVLGSQTRAGTWSCTLGTKGHPQAAGS